MNRIRKFLPILLVLAAIASAPKVTAGQIVSNTSSVTLKLTTNESLSVSASPATITFTASGSNATASGPISVTTTWALSTSRNAVYTSAYLSSASGALSDSNGNNIPSSSVYSVYDGVGAALPCTASAPAGGMGGANGEFCQGHSTPTASALFDGVLSTVGYVGSNTDTILLSLQGVSAVPTSYTGQLNIVALAS